jgi:mRNA-degrading endonuclease RelE of RelBE toxin-antitoxin system
MRRQWHGRVGAFVSHAHPLWRRLSLKVFPYRIIYRIEGSEIVVYALAHVRRRPGYWRKRIAK